MGGSGSKSSGRLARWAMLFAFLAVAYGWAQLLPLGDFALLALVLSAATFVMAWAIWANVHAGDEKKAIEKARLGLLPGDGEWGVAVGPIEPLTDEAPTAPFSGRKAVAYIYRVFRKERVRSSRGTSTEYELAAYVGRAVALSEVRTAAGPVKVLGMPLLEVDKELLSGWDVLGRARDYLSQTAFVEKEHEAGRGGSEVVYSTKGFDAGASGLREDFRYSEVTDLSDWLLEETVVVPGREVHVFGWYSEALGALVCPPEGSEESKSVKMLVLRPGGLEEALKVQRRHAGCSRFLGVVALVVQVAFVAAYCGRGDSKEGGGKQTLTFTEASSFGEPRLVKLLAEKKVDLLARDENGRTAAHLAGTAETLGLVLDAAPLLEVRDAYGDTPLMFHAEGDRPDFVRVLVKHGAKLDEEDSRGFTAIQMTDSLEVVGVLLAAGARDADGEVARGEPLPPDGGEPWQVVLAELDAMARADADASNALWSRRTARTATAESLRAFDWWPRTATLLEGHVLGDRALVEGEGKSGTGGTVRLVGHLVREEGAWKLLGLRIRA